MKRLAIAVTETNFPIRKLFNTFVALLTSVVAASLILFVVWYSLGCNNSPEFVAEVDAFSQFMFKEFINKHNITTWLDYGTLIWHQRGYKGIGGRDHDHDFSTMYEYLPQSVVADFCEEWRQQIRCDQYRRGQGHTFQIQFRRRSSLSIHMDLWVFRNYEDELGTRMIRGTPPRVSRNLPVEFVFPLRPVEYLGFHTNLPAQPGKILTEYYGKNYMTPFISHMECYHANWRQNRPLYQNDLRFFVCYGVITLFSCIFFVFGYLFLQLKPLTWALILDVLFAYMSFYGILECSILFSLVVTFAHMFKGHFVVKFVHNVINRNRS